MLSWNEKLSRAQLYVYICIMQVRSCSHFVENTHIEKNYNISFKKNLQNQFGYLQNAHSSHGTYCNILNSLFKRRTGITFPVLYPDPDIL